MIKRLILVSLICVCSTFAQTVGGVKHKHIPSSAPPGGGVTDNFNRTSLGDNWTNWLNTASIYNSTVLIGGGTSNNTICGYTGATFANNQYAQATSTNVVGGQGVVVRGSSVGGYEFDSDGYYLYFARWSANWTTRTALTGDDGSLTVSAGDVLKITASGTTITAYLNGEQVAQATDANIGSGVAGCIFGSYQNDNTKQLDNFSAGDL